MGGDNCSAQSGGPDRGGAKTLGRPKCVVSSIYQMKSLFIGDSFEYFILLVTRLSGEMVVFCQLVVPKARARVWLMSCADQLQPFYAKC